MKAIQVVELGVIGIFAREAYLAHQKANDPNMQVVRSSLMMSRNTFALIAMGCLAVTLYTWKDPWQPLR